MSYLRENQEQSNEKLSKVAAQSRLEVRVLWDKLLTIVLGTLGFSLTLFSTDSLSSQITSSCSKYYLLISWILYAFSLLTGFILMKRETTLQFTDALAQSLYSLDKFELLDENSLKVKEGKEGHLIALEVLHSNRVDEDISWSQIALDNFKKYKEQLYSYKLVKNANNFYSNKDEKSITNIAKIFYGLILIATTLLIISVSMILI
jgi:hypothetical protein